MCPWHECFPSDILTHEMVSSFVYYPGRKKKSTWVFLLFCNRSIFKKINNPNFQKNITLRKKNVCWCHYNSLDQKYRKIVSICLLMIEWKPHLQKLWPYIAISLGCSYTQGNSFKARPCKKKDKKTKQKNQNPEIEFPQSNQCRKYTYKKKTFKD